MLGGDAEPVLEVHGCGAVVAGEVFVADENYAGDEDVVDWGLAVLVRGQELVGVPDRLRVLEEGVVALVGHYTGVLLVSFVQGAEG